MRELHVFDMSQLVHIMYDKVTLTLGVREGSGMYEAKEMYCGGLAYALSMIFKYYNEESDLVFTFDTPPTYRRNIYKELCGYDGYKSNRRNRNRTSVAQQYELAYEVLQSLNFTVLRKDGYEADDLIYNVVKQFHTFYNRVYVHSNDSDQFFLVRDNVVIVPVTHGRSLIDIHNYENCVSSSRYIKYNTMLLDKIIVGDTSDAVRGISSDMADIVLNTIPPSIYPELGDPNLLRSLLRVITKNDRRVMLTTDLILPMEVYEDIEINMVKLNQDLFSFYAHYCSTLKRYRSDYVHSDIGYEILNNILERG